MEAKPRNRISALIGAAADALGSNLILDKVADLICAELNCLSNEDAPAALPEATPAITSPVELAKESVYGLPPNSTWTRTPAELPVKKLVARDVQHAIGGVVLRSESGQMHFALYDPKTNELRVPGGFLTTRSKSAEYMIPRNGAYRWRLVGFVEGPST